MARRLPSQPPTLPGFSHLHVLGAGGFADVFLYEQNMPRRQVAVKVMLSEVVNDHVRQMFQAEANLMAQLSAHPYIVTIYHADVASDDRESTGRRRPVVIVTDTTCRGRRTSAVRTGRLVERPRGVGCGGGGSHNRRVGGRLRGRAPLDRRAERFCTRRTRPFGLTSLRQYRAEGTGAGETGALL